MKRELRASVIRKKEQDNRVCYEFALSTSLLSSRKIDHCRLA